MRRAVPTGTPSTRATTLTGRADTTATTATHGGRAMGTTSGPDSAGDRGARDVPRQIPTLAARAAAREMFGPQPTRLVGLIPPRLLETTVGYHATALATVAGGADTGIALEASGRGGVVSFAIRGATPDDASALGGPLLTYYPQTEPHALVAGDPAQDPAALLRGEKARACELVLAADGHLPLSPASLAEDAPLPDQFLAVLSALRELPRDIVGVAQLSLWPGPDGFGRELHTQQRTSETDARQREKGAGGGKATSFVDGLPVVPLVALGGGAAALVEAYLSYQHGHLGDAGLWAF